MSYNEWRNTSIKICLILLFSCILIFAFSFVFHPSYTAESVVDTYNISIGQTVFAGDSILANNEIIRVPLISNFNFLLNEISTMDIQGLLISLSTGTVPFDFTTISSQGLTSYGRATGFKGPGSVAMEGDKLAVKEPGSSVWGYSFVYKKLTKTSSGVDVVENGKVIESVPEAKIKDQTWGNNYYNITSIQNWYNYDAKIGSNFTLEKGISNFSDNRTAMSPDQVEKVFGKNVLDYIDAYPTGNPIVLYLSNYTLEKGEDYYTALGSYPEYGDGVRAYNAQQFCLAWNNTFIPPHSTSTGKSYIDFGVASDPEAVGGAASHGVCPPARGLRNAALGEGFNIPIGMTMDQSAVQYGYNPAEDITVSNNHDYPVQIVMWYEGSGASMVLHCQMVRYIPT